MPRFTPSSHCRVRFATLLLVGLSVCLGVQSSLGQPVPVFVNFRTAQVTAGSTPTGAGTATIAPPPSGWAYSAAAPVSGSVWNQILRPNPGIASGVGATAGTFVLNSANGISLADANGNGTSVKLTAAIVIGDTTGSTRTEPATGNGTGTGVLEPVGLCDQAWRIYSGANTTLFTFSGLPASRHYYVYGIGTCGTSGAKFNVPAAYLAPGETASKATTGGNSGNLFVFDGTNYSLYSGTSVLWVRFHVVTDAAGKLQVGTSKNSSNAQYLNGLQLMPFPVPVISLQPPATVTATTGSSLSIPVTATGDGTLSYAWRQNGVPIDAVANPSAATSILSLANVSDADAASYDVVVTNEGGSVTSSPSVLTVGTSAVAPSITISPGNQSAAVGGAATFTVSANGTAPLTYTWQKSTDNVAFTDIANSNSVQLSLVNLQTSDAGYYRVIVSNSVGTATSNSATLAIAPVLTTQPVGGTVAAGAAATLSVGVDVGTGAPFATTYVWKRNGVTVTDSNGISGSSTANLQFASFAAANSGVYSVTASNPAGAVTSQSVYLGTPTTLTSTLWPASNATSVNPDTPPTIRFNGAPVVGTVGQVRIYDAATDAIVETIDLASLSVKVGGVATYRYATRTVGDRTYDYFPIVVVGNEARIALKSSKELGFNKTYYVQVDPGVLLDSTGASYPGISDKTTWRFTTKATGLASTAATITVAADGSGDFTTLQGAIDFIPYSPANTVPRTIMVKPGIYNEEVNLRVGQNNVTINGAGRSTTVVQYLNNNDLLPPGSDFSSRAVFRDETTNLALNDLSVRNLTLHGGGQAEAIAIRGSLATISRCNFYSFQDTLFLSQQIFLTDCYIEGDTDFIWGGNAFFQRCEMKMMNPAWDSNPRSSATQLGFIFVNCVFSRASATAVPNGSGWFSRDFGSSAAMFALFNCAVDQHINPVGWSVSATDLSSVRYWEFGSTKLDGTPYDVSGRPTWNHMSTGALGAAPVMDHQQVDAITAAYYSNPQVVVGFSPVVAPEIDTPPSSQTLDLGGAAVFSVAATGGYPAAAYQWFKDGVAIDLNANPSAATAQLSLPNVQVGDMGVYTVTVTNTSGSVTSSGAALAINGQPPVIYTQPVGALVSPGSAAMLNVQAIGAGALSYQWKFNGVPLVDGPATNGVIVSGATTSSLNLTGIQLSNEGAYTVDVQNASGVTTSAPAQLTVDALPTIVSQPVAQAVTPGANVTFAVGATGVTNIWYQWQKNGVAIAGATSSTLSLSNVGASDSATYSVTVSSRAGTVTSNGAALTVVPFALPNIPSQSFDVTSYGAVGDNATDNTNAIQAALNAAGAAGGGTVSIPAGTFLCGPISLSSGTNLSLAPGCVLKMLPLGLWPNAPYTSGTTPNFISIVGVHDVMVSGGGQIDGQGQAWWDRVDGTNGVTAQITVRPGCAIDLENATSCAVLGITLINTPNINVAVGKASQYVAVANVTISEPADSPNTDGIHVAGQDLLIDHCTINNGDDDIVINSGTSGPATADITITNCTIGTGHGCSIGSYTNASGNGISNVTVSGLTFNGTTAGINLKSEPGRGGVVQNLTYSNIVMTNVAAPISISSYYGTVGSSGATGSNRITSAVVAAYNAAPPVSLATTALPEWKNITISNLTATGATNYSVIWGLPNKPVTNLTLNNINVSGGYGFELYNADVQFTGSNSIVATANPVALTTYNANVITTQPQGASINVGQSATFTVGNAGTSGVNNVGSTYQWAINGVALTDGAQNDGSSVSGSTTATLTISNARVTNAGNVTCTLAGTLDTYDVAAAALTPNAMPVSITSTPATLAVAPLPVTLSLSNLSFTYDGAPKAPTVTTVPSGVAVVLNYNGAASAPAAAGNYTVVAAVADPNYVGSSAEGTLVVAPAPLSITAVPVSKEYGVADPQLGYAISGGTLFGSDAISGAQTRATGETVGTYPITQGTLTAGPNYTLTYVGADLTITPRPASVSPNPATKVYGSPDPILSGTLAGFLPADNVTATYARSPGESVGGSPYVITGTLAANAALSNYVITSSTAAFTITPATATITVKAYTGVYDGTAHGATGSATGVNGTDVSSFLNLGASYTNVPGGTATWTFVDPAGNYVSNGGSVAITLTKAPVTIELAPLVQFYDGTPKPVTATTTETPTAANLTVDVTYNGATVAPTLPGTYAVVADVNDPNYAGTATGTLTVGITALVRHGLSLDGNIDGSLQLLLGEKTALNGSAGITGDLLVPGTPTVLANGHATYVGVQDAGGGPTPSNYTVILGGNSLARYVVRRVDAIGLPTVAAPALPNGTRDVVLTNATASIGDPATIRNLTLNGNAGQVVLPPGTYGNITASAGNGFTLGIAGATTPAVYNLQTLTLSGGAHLEIVGPVVITLANGLTVAGSAGTTDHSEWLVVRIASGDATLSGGAAVVAYIIAPNGTVTLDGNAVLTGSVAADRLVINGAALLRQPAK